MYKMDWHQVMYAWHHVKTISHHIYDLWHHWHHCSFVLYGIETLYYIEKAVKAFWYWKLGTTCIWRIRLSSMIIRTNIVYIQFVYILLFVVWRTIREYFTTHKDVIIYGEGLQILGISPGGHLNRKGSFSCHTCKNGNEINSRQA